MVVLCENQLELNKAIEQILKSDCNKTKIDECNGHNHDGEYHYHSTNSYPSFIGCFKAKPYESNFRQKRASNSVCP